MVAHWQILLISFGYLSLLFAVAYYGDKRADVGKSIISNPYIYTFSIAVYCTGWTFYGSVGKAASTGIGFLPIYLGPTVAAILWWIFLRKIINISKAYHITSIADFIASRYGKSPFVGGLVTTIAVVGIMPYIALQLKAISASFNVLFNYETGTSIITATGHDTALYVTLILAIFSILFGTRHIDVTERHEGMVAAIAFESIVKLLSFTAVGIFVTFVIFDGPTDLYSQAVKHPDIEKLMTLTSLPYASWFAMTFISMTAIMFLPRQFQILVVENVNINHVRTASWCFPLYLFAINLFVIPIAFTGLMFFHPSQADADMFVLTIALQSDMHWLALFVFIGGLSAATGMVIVETVALSTMLCNDFLMPLLLRFKIMRRIDMGRMLLSMRRGGIILILLLGYLYFRLIGESYTLVTIGLVSFVAAAQFAPAILLGIYWKGASKSGALAGLLGGFLIWIYTLLLPSFAHSGWLPISFVKEGLLGIHWLKPYQLFNLVGFDPITHSVFWSLLINVGLLGFVSMLSRQSALEQLQSAMFVDYYKKRPSDATDAPLWYGKTRVKDLKKLMARMVGEETAQSAFCTYADKHNLQLQDDTLADEALISFTERELSGAVGAASARVMVSSIIEGETLSIDALMKILDETSAVIEYSHRLEQKSKELEKATAELKLTNERLKELDKLKDEFISTISHELRTPLTSIRAFSEILLDDEKMDAIQRKQLLRIVVQETERLTRLVNQILDFTKIESGAYQWVMQKVDLNEVAEEGFAATSQLANNMKIQMSISLPDAPVYVFADKDRLIQVVINLLSNAINYTPAVSGKVQLIIRTTDTMAMLEVADNGPGIKPQDRLSIFDKFHQLKDSVKGKPQGTGLGLAICKTIIENHNGKIWVQDNEWQGASFIVELQRHSP